MLDITVSERRVIQDELIPAAQIGLRRDVTDFGREISIIGEIRRDPDIVLRIEELRVRQDNVARDLDLEDGSAIINAKLGDPEYSWNVEDGLDIAAYRVVFHETS